MICIVLHCDQENCSLEQGYPLGVIKRENNGEESHADTAMRLGAMYGWRRGDCVRAEDGNGIAETCLCPDHSGVPKE